MPQAKQGSRVTTVLSLPVLEVLILAFSGLLSTDFVQETVVPTVTATNMAWINVLETFITHYFSSAIICCVLLTLQFTKTLQQLIYFLCPQKE